MAETPAQATSLKPLLDRMVAGRQLSFTDAESLLRAKSPPQTEEDILREVMNTVGKPGKLGEQVKCAQGKPSRMRCSQPAGVPMG